MGIISKSNFVPRYHGARWIDAALPVDAISWPDFISTNDQVEYPDGLCPSHKELSKYTHAKPWVFPLKDHYFLTDLHGDVDALRASLLATGAVEVTGPEDTDFILNDSGRAGVFVIGGDCFDKGPSTIRLLRGIKHLIDLGAQVELLVGNHDLRTFIGLACAEVEDTLHEHLFVRMGKKTVPLFKEIFDFYIGLHSPRDADLSDLEIEKRLFPSDDWFVKFPIAAEHILTEKQIAKEVRRIGEKQLEFKEAVRRNGMSLSDLYAALTKARELFFDEEGEFNWLFSKLKLGYRAGSFLFVHAGVDDVTARILKDSDVDGLNAAYQDAMSSDLFNLYNGPLGNMFRTKYRDTDMTFSESGLTDLKSSGIYAVVHGHRNMRAGQRMTFRHGLLNFECDASVDSGTRALEGFSGLGAAATIIGREGYITAVSSDFPMAKVFPLNRYCQTILNV